MKHFLPILWWLASVPVIALVITSIGYPFGPGCAIAVMFLPGMLCARYFFPQISFAEPRKGILDCIFLGLAILITEYLCIMLTNAYIDEFCIAEIPSLLLNPLFLLVVLTAFIVPEMMLEKYLSALHPHDDTITFTSDRRKITLDPAGITYIESNDSEVWIHTASGDSFRTKTRISQWEGQLDTRFLRIHRAFIVNTHRIGDISANRIVVDGKEIDISRKYKEEVRRRLATRPEVQPE